MQRSPGTILLTASLATLLFRFIFSASHILMHKFRSTAHLRSVRFRKRSSQNRSPVQPPRTSRKTVLFFVLSRLQETREWQITCVPHLHERERNPTAS